MPFHFYQLMTVVILMHEQMKGSSTRCSLSAHPAEGQVHFPDSSLPLQQAWRPPEPCAANGHVFTGTTDPLAQQ